MLGTGENRCSYSKNKFKYDSFFFVYVFIRPCFSIPRKYADGSIVQLKELCRLASDDRATATAAAAAWVKGNSRVKGSFLNGPSFKNSFLGRK